MRRPIGTLVGRGESQADRRTVYIFNCNVNGNVNIGFGAYLGQGF
ncbi:MAG: hypothetical protein OWQ54_03365 [Sulfolobaceae archaeon]|nr:hypothetical protein [Sulfolobaceae archaeon]